VLLEKGVLAQNARKALIEPTEQKDLSANFNTLEISGISETAPS